MASVTVVPFLVALILMNKRSLDQTNYEYTFQVDVKTAFFRSWFIERQMAHLSIELNCYHVSNNSMMCRVGNSSVLEPVPKTLSANLSYADKSIDYRVFQNDSEPFQVNFSSKGISSYVVERDAIPVQLMNVYRMIANQLSIGTNIKQKGKEFNELERSNIGLCPTKFKIVKFQPTPAINIFLTSLVDLDIQEDDILITKRRNVPMCHPSSNYCFSIRLWPDLVPESTATHTLVQSISSLTLSSSGIKALTQNAFNVYDKNNTLIADIIETITLKLSSYRTLLADRMIKFDEKKTVLLDVINVD